MCTDLFTAEWGEKCRCDIKYCLTAEAAFLVHAVNCAGISYEYA